MTVILITLDGVRPDAIQQAHTPTLDHIMETGAYTMQARSVMPSITLPCHMSIFHSVPPQRHGILVNVYQPLARPLPGLFEQIRSAGKQSASFYGWEPLRDLSRPLSVSYASYIETNSDDMICSDRPTVDVALPIIESGAYDFIFLYLWATDEMGHREGWMSDPYLKQLEIADTLLAEVMQVLPAGSHLLVEADHGGHDRNHGTDSPEDMTVPWMVWGDTVRQGYVIQDAVTLLDTAPTAAHLLGIAPAPQWEGRVIEAAFRSPNGNEG